jgi:hypothetical protein
MIKFTLKFSLLRSLIYFFFLSQLATAQVADYFAHQPKWTVNSACAEPYPCIKYEDREYHLGSDTLISGNLYHTVLARGIGYYAYMAPPPPVTPCSGTFSYQNDTLPLAFIRQSGRTIRQWNTATQMDELMYDFDLQIGDTLPLSSVNYDPNDFVTAIDSVWIRNSFRKVFYTNGGVQLTEGVGSNRGFLEPMSVMLECGYQFTCFSLNDSTWLPVQGATCALVSGVPKQDEAGITVFPNPANDELFIANLSNSISGNYLFSDLSGKEIFSGVLSPQHPVPLQTSQLCEGMYLLYLRTSDQALVRKIIITHP